MKTSINPSFPIEDVSSIDRLMAIAVGMEHEAARRYRELAAAMHQAHEPDMARLFEELAVLELDHGRQLADWAEREGRVPPQPASFAWLMPETMDAGGGEARVMTPYKALSVAVRNEERAFTFYSYMAAMAERDEVRDRAEALAREELSHVAQLRAMRRKAYHVERDERGPRRRPPADLPGLYRLALGLETGSHEIDAAAARVLQSGCNGLVAAAMERLAEEDRRSAALLARHGGDGAGDAAPSIENARAAGLMKAEALSVTGAMQLALRNAEEVLDAYMSAAEAAADEALMREAQRLGELAVARLAVVRSLIADVED